MLVEWWRLRAPRGGRCIGYDEIVLDVGICFYLIPQDETAS